MFARVTTFYGRQELVDKAIRIVEDSIVPAARKQKGFQGFTLLIDRKAGKGLSITLWDSEEDALANEKNKYYHEQLMKLIVIFTADPIREGFEVAFDSGRRS
jgi:heme-degrading monooxygenase HmoA